MKKLVVALAGIAIAIGASAAQIDWKSAVVYAGNDTDKIADGSLGYLVVGSETLTKEAIIAAVSGVSGKTASEWIDDNAIIGKTAASSKFATGGAIDYTSGKYSVYAVVFDSATISDTSKVFVSDAASVTVPGSGTGTASFTATLLAGAKDSSGWKSVGPTQTPEPTSGLLLLLGMAGLALRRRRA